MTYLKVVNNVLRRLRESTVGSVNDNEYSRLIGEFVNDVKEEIENLWYWTNLRTTITVTTASGTDSYSLTGSGDRAKLMMTPDGRFNVWDDTNQVWLTKVPSYRLMDFYRDQSNATSGKPTHFSFEGLDSNLDLKVAFWPNPDGAYTIKFHMYVPQPRLAAGTDDTTEIKIPSGPLIYGVWSRAIYERGEDQNYLSDLAAVSYQRLLAQAIELDRNLSSESTDWVVV